MKKIENNSTSSKSEVTPWYIVRLLGEIGFVIAGPLVVFLLVGRWIDIKLGTKIIFMLLGMVTALGISSYSIYQKIKIINSLYDDKTKK